MTSIDLAVVGGSGLYEIDGLTDLEEVALETPFGPPSDTVHLGTLAGRRVAFLARHGRGHTLLPSEVPYRANIWALKSLGVTRLLAISAVGSMRVALPPRHMVLVDQFVDRTHGRPSTFFGDGIVAHVSVADPTCASLRRGLADVSRTVDVEVRDGGTYLCMEGPAFSTRAESNLYRSWGVDVIGMTHAQEARLCREAEICFATLAMVTDFDCWHDDEEDVSVDGVLATMAANGAAAAELLRNWVAGFDTATPRTCACATALDAAILTPRERIPAATRERLAPILDRVLRRERA